MSKSPFVFFVPSWFVPCSPNPGFSVSPVFQEPHIIPTMRFAALLLSASLLAAQDPAPAQAPPVIKMTTRQVQVSVVVRDKKGQPVADLKLEDFELLDKGQPQQIRYFRAEKNEEAPASADLPPGVVSNRVVSTGGGHQSSLPNALTIILLDGLNTRYSDRSLAREGLVKFLSALKPGDHVAVYTLTNQLRVLHNFASDISELQQGLTHHKGKESTPESEAIERFLTESISPMIVNFPQLRTPATMEALRVIAFQLAGIPGRKNLVWLSDGFPLTIGRRANGAPGRNFQTFNDDETRTIKALDDAGVAIYPVDARGMIGTFETNPSTAPATRTPRSRRAAGAMDSQAQFAIADSQGALQQIADGTGGVAFMNSNDLGSAIRRAVDDSSVSYVLGYSPSHDEWTGEFREIKIKLNRPGVEAHYRKGYYAMPEKAQDADARMASLMAAVASPLPSTGLGLVGRVVTDPGAASAPAENATANASASRVAVRLLVNPAELGFTHNADGNWIAQVDLVLVVRDAAGHPSGQIGQTYRLTLSQKEYDQASKEGVALDASAASAAGGSGKDAAGKPARARVVVRDAATGAVGSLDLPIVEGAGKN
jgi:VWFA-related protein